MKLKTSKPECIWKKDTLLGEGPIWLPSKKSIFFVDIKKKNILILNIKNNKKKIIKLDKEIGFLFHIKKNIFILGLQSELRIIDIKTKKVFYSIPIELHKPFNRLNDGKIDPKGRLWFGTMDNLERKKKSGSLYCLDNQLNIHEIDKGYYITNGPAFLDNNTFYHTDSRKKIIYKMKIDKKFKLIKKKTFLKFSKTDGAPDGMITDIKNNLWVCHYGGALISVYNLKGKKIHKLKIPAKNVTNCVFGGLKNNELFISTARKNMKLDDLKKYPLSGSLFKSKLNIKGKKSKVFKILSLKG